MIKNTLRQQRIIDNLSEFLCKPCSKCRRILPATITYFAKDLRGRLGVTSVCKLCTNKNGIGVFEVSDKKTCTECKEVLPNTLEYFYKNNGRCKDGKYPKCKNCVCMIASTRRPFYNLKDRSEYTTEWAKTHRGNRNASAGKRRAIKLQATPRWSESDEILALYDAADYLSRLTGVQWDVDHEVPLINKHVSGLHVYENLQLLTHYENIRKSNKFRKVY